MSSSNAAWQANPSRSSLILFGPVLVIAILSGAFTAYSPQGVAAGLIIVVVWLVLFRFPVEALAILVTGFYLYPVTVNALGVGTSTSLTVGYYSVVSTAALTGILHRCSRPPRVVFSRRETLMMLALAGWMLLSWLVLSLTNEYALKKIGIIPWLMVTPFLAPQFMERKLLERFLKACVFVGVFGVMLTALSVMRGTQADSLRVSVSDSVSALGFAYSMGVSALLAVTYGIFSTRASTKVLSGTFLIGVVVLTVASGSRGPLLALGLSLLVVGILVNRPDRVYLLMLIGFAASIIIAVLPYVSSPAQARMAVLLSQSNMQASQSFAESRGYMWLHGLTAWQSSPLFGIGIGNYIVFSQNTTYWAEGGFAHNFIIEILSELGLIGIVLFGGFSVLIAQGVLSLLIRRRNDVVVVSAVAMLVFSLFKMSFSGQLQASIEFWVVSGLITGLSART